MKIHLHLTSLLLCFILAFAPLKNISAQGFYFNVGGGYNFNTNNITSLDFCSGFDQNPNVWYYPYSGYFSAFPPPFTFTGANQTYSESVAFNGQGEWTNTSQSLNKGFGGGVSFYASAGYAFTKNISAEIGFLYLAGTTLQSTYLDNTYSINSPVDSDDNKLSLTNTLTSSARYRLIPTVKLSIPLSKFTPYLKAGLIVGLVGKLALSNSYSLTEILIDNGQTTPVPNSSEILNIGLTATGGLSLGYTASAGLEYAISDFLSVYGEVNLISENWSPTTGTITTFSVYESGTAIPVTLTSSQFTYSNNVSAGAANKTNIVEINGEYPKQTFSYGSYGVNIGVKFSIPKKTKPSIQPDTQAGPK